MGAFGEMLKVYWGDPTLLPAKQVFKKISELELKYEEDRKNFENGYLSFKEKKILVGFMGKYHKRISYNSFMYYCDWLEFTENGKYHYWEVINNKNK